MTTGQKIARKCGLIGAGIGGTLYLIFGLAQGAVLGGTAGIALANWVFGERTIEIMGNELMTRVIVGGAMLTGVVVSLVMFLVAGSAMGYACGRLLGLAVREGETFEGEEVAKGSKA